MDESASENVHGIVEDRVHGPGMPTIRQAAKVLGAKILSGVVVAGILVGCSGAPGAHRAAEDLFHHVVLVHPLLWSFVAFLVAALVFVQGADVLIMVDRLFGKPLLEFFSHLFAVAAGAFPVLLLIAPPDWSVANCRGATGAVLFLAFLLLFAAYSTVGCELVTARSEQARRATSAANDSAAAGRPGQAKLWHLYVFGVIAVGAFVTCVLGASDSAGTARLVNDRLDEAKAVVCGR